MEALDGSQLFVQSPRSYEIMMVSSDEKAQRLLSLSNSQRPATPSHDATNVKLLPFAHD